MWTAASLALLAIWFGLSILAQFDNTASRAARSRDAFSLLPRWTFFAHPGFSDYHLMYRDLLPDNSLAAWREILPADKRTLGKALWNPDKRCRKALFDTVDLLIQLRKKDPQQPLASTMPYLTILNYVISQRHAPQATSTQFMVVRTGGFLTDSKPRLIFRSDWHSVAR
ncbi:MAG TPA: hypothetical protein VF789_26745 [Thermoanaerobaculia bacterium]